MGAVVRGHGGEKDFDGGPVVVVKRGDEGRRSDVRDLEDATWSPGRGNHRSARSVRGMELDAMACTMKVPPTMR